MGDKYQNIIEINGKKYDAASGRLLSSTKAQSSTPPQQMVKKNGVALDGFVRKKSTALAPNNTTKPTHTAEPARSTHHHKKSVQKSQTLMRQAVKKPSKATPSPSQRTSHHNQISKPTLQAPRERIEMASSVKKSSLVHRFSSHAYRSSVKKSIGHLPVKQPAEISHHQAPPITTSTSGQSQQMSQTERLIESALASATSHEQPEHKTFKKKRRALSQRFGVSPKVAGFSTFVLAAALLVGFYAVQNVPNLAMRVASSRAGFSANMPTYSPAGFRFQGPIQHSTGQVSISFRSNTDDRTYTLTQRESNWNSDALLSEFVVASNKQYQTYLDRGRTLYIYDGSNATWVDNGVWYQIEGESAMTTDQLVRIASSL